MNQAAAYDALDEIRRFNYAVNQILDALLDLPIEERLRVIEWMNENLPNPSDINGTDDRTSN